MDMQVAEFLSFSGADQTLKYFDYKYEILLVFFTPIGTC